jgi:hypothetical protein
MFVAPSWVEGTIIYALIIVLIPLIIGLGIAVLAKSRSMEDGLFLGFVVMGLLVIPMIFLSGVYWHYNYEVPSVQEKIITVSEWQPRPGISTNSNGMMVIDNADQLMLITTDGEGFLNQENFLFQKFDTRDVLLQLKPGGTYRVEYYGWREGFNSGFPNILRVVEVIDESGAEDVKVSDYFGTKIV